MHIYGRKLTKNWKRVCPNCGWINIWDSKRPRDKCHRCGHKRIVLDKEKE